MKIKIKQLFDEITKQKVYPLTTLKAVRDPKSKKALDEMLLISEDESGDVDVESRDADTLGGRYTAEDLDAMPKSSAIEDYANVEPPMIDADYLGGKKASEYATKSSVDKNTADIGVINSNLEKLQIGTFIKQIVNYPDVFSLSQGQSTTISFTLPTVEGYKPFLIEGINLGTALCCVGSFYFVNDTTAQIMLTNAGNQGSVAVKPYISVLYQATAS